jgi:hypothetical protein
VDAFKIRIRKVTTPTLQAALRSADSLAKSAADEHVHGV